tara:strand:+ start:18600 stop:19577 length:978 start_codon:yes stop_codon:yes gene_type:complete
MTAINYLTLQHLGFFILSIAVLVLAGFWLVRYLSRIAFYLRLSDFIVSFVIIAFSSSIPELFVGIKSAMAGTPTLSLGNVIGSNIADLTIIIGIPLIFARNIKISKVAKRDSIYMVLIAALPIGLMLIGQRLSRLDGAFLVLLFFLYMWRQIRQRKDFKRETTETLSRLKVVLTVTFFIASLFLLFYSADYTVKYAELLSIDFNFPPILIGLFLVALGTSLPELSFNMQAVLKGHKDMALGDTIGSVVANSTLVLGVTALIHPIANGLFLFLISSIFMIIIAFLFATMMDKGEKLNWKEGITLVMFYAFFITVELYIMNIRNGGI